MDGTQRTDSGSQASRRLLHTPACGVRVAVSLGASIVVDPGPDERTRRLHLARATCSSALIALAFVIGVATAPMAAAGGHLWIPLATLGLAVVGRIARPPHRTIPHPMLADLTWLNSIDRQERALAHRLVWGAVTDPVRVGAVVGPTTARASHKTDADA